MIKRCFMLLMLCGFITAPQAAELNLYPDEAATPALKLPDLQGRMHDLNDYKGQVVLVQFWATYCTPCRKEMPSMNKLMKKMGDVPFKILAVDMGESRDEVTRFVKEVKPDFTILMDADGHTIGAWRVFAAPSNFIIDPKGKIRYTLFGGVQWDSDQMVEQLKALAAQ